MFCSFAKEKEFDPLVAENWYPISADSVFAFKVYSSSSSLPSPASPHPTPSPSPKNILAIKLILSILSLFYSGLFFFLSPSVTRIDIVPRLSFVLENGWIIVLETMEHWDRILKVIPAISFLSYLFFYIYLFIYYCLIFNF